MLFMEASAMRALNVNAAFKLLVAEVMHQADTIASQPPAFEHKLKVNAERSRRANRQAQDGRSSAQGKIWPLKTGQW